ncbi:hypothetical protein [Helcococcus sueciensis]|uniref:hypothetical protein n=1 Tax=Helcococcus sueciensis TaxID=241555 RepID=UPI000423E4A3|nr:hypothetical protein [Helcococcus sueciensis]
MKKEGIPAENQTSKEHTPQSPTIKPRKGLKIGDAGIAIMSAMLLVSIDAYVLSSKKKNQ